MTGPCDPFADAERAGVYRAIENRRDTRHFAGGEVPEDVLARLLAAAHHAPSVGLMQPWRFLRIVDPAVRVSIRDVVEAERVRTAAALGSRAEEFGRLKVEGITECAEVIVVALGTGRDAHVFGRRTMPQMDLASVACAIQNMWLAARAEGYGMGWVSMFDPVELAALLGIPEAAQPVAVLCLGPVDAFYERPMLVETGWAVERPLSELCATDRWPAT
ncbi:5,6-dimethylbenzimidazole synthase [Williamsia sp. SKLECPSW1]